MTHTITKQPLIILFISFTRRWALERFLSNLESVNFDPSATSIALLVDVDEPFVFREFERYAEKHGFKKFVGSINRDNNPNEVRVAARRQAIANMKNASKTLITQCEGDIIIGLEDDTVFENMDIARLYEPLLRDDKIGFVEGVQCGRWGVKMIGAWSVDDYEFPQRAETLLLGSDYEDIDAGGFYGYATRRELYLNHDYFTSAGQPWGPDVNYGLWLRNRGYKCLVDWSMPFGHNDYGKILYPDDRVSKVVYNRDITTGKWGRNDTDKTG